MQQQQQPPPDQKEEPLPLLSAEGVSMSKEDYVRILTELCVVRTAMLSLTNLLLQTKVIGEPFYRRCELLLPFTYRLNDAIRVCVLIIKDWDRLQTLKRPELWKVIQMYCDSMNMPD